MGGVLVVAARELEPLFGALAAALGGELCARPRVQPRELDPVGYADALIGAERSAFATTVRRARPDALVLAAADSYLLSSQFPLPHPCTIVVGPATHTLDAAARGLTREARGLVIGPGRAVGGLRALAAGLAPAGPVPDGAVAAVQRWIAESAPRLAAWRAGFERLHETRNLTFGPGQP